MTTKTAKHNGFLIDVSRCIDCRSCMVACNIENNVPMTTTRIWMKDTNVMGQFPNLKQYTAPYHCMHCDDPSCVSACTVGALQTNEQGVIIYDDKRCIGCRYCMYACPFEVPNFEWEQRFSLIVKCDMCIARLQEGQKTACAATCPPEAIQFGKYEDMLAEAKKRLETHPDKYIQHIYGEHENGGTSTLYISPVPFEQLGFPTAETVSPAYSNRLITHGTPAVAGAVAVGLAGIYLTIKKQKEQDAEETPEVEDKKAIASVQDEEKL